ncbi:DUF1120 domain-containing protein [Burkholderia sp. IMCC1007]|uniref:DUF1120 domain-containing protein n=1 Tax=Burkholderia sp. IMCC1007 TaxID=3004104 RepID=UPI0022B3D66A|nr:DUF1120 domain-containing protein [Burkholderia sp. IMCC1007]
MKKKLAGLWLVAGALVVAGHAQADKSVDVRVAGKIVPDGACNLTISNGGVYDFGTIASENLHQNKTTQFAAKWETAAVTCNAATKVALSVRDNRAGTAAGGTGEDFEFGLGKGKVGYYTLTVSSAMGDGDSWLDVVSAPAGSDAWAHDKAGLMTKDSARKSFAEPGSSAPGAYKSIAIVLGATPTINKLSELDLSNGNVDLDGSATLDLTYL